MAGEMRSVVWLQGRPLAPIRLANAAAQLVLRTQARRKEEGSHRPTLPPPPLLG